MVTYIIRRLIWGVVMLAIVSMITFAIFFLVPRLAGATSESLAARYVGRTATAEQVKLAAERLGFNDPLVVQYGRFAKGIVAGADYSYGPTVEHCPAPCLGYSFLSRLPVWPDLLDRVPVTGSLAIGAAIIWLIAGVATGVISALRRGSLFDRAAMSVALAGVSLPIFFTGIVSLVLFSYGRPFAITAPGGSYTPFLTNPALWAYGLILPWITLAFLYAAGYARLTRSGMLETMNEDYIRTARAKGLTERVVVVKHGLRGALTPILTIFGLDLGLLMGGAVLTESTFSLPGIGKYAIDAIVNQDLPKVMGVVLVAAFFVVLANLLVDLLYAVVDPRVRLA
ncbi:ABC transporter permease [Sphaerisporangium melleum]|uniref:ABC transporter permease n=1 Tax=Sphaerisporangium melleum TaxID=321316 RepID=A0A917VTN0_9ACTN|nr:ABC transporter permease [Sphaerisporangium melleum]GGL17341.1 ABC transporter permease [Sphaerisporangium melleum]GII74746.1 ABC transporter permease [Sphaerisporangium melleum]